MLSTTGGKLKVSPKKILENYNKIKKINIFKNSFDISEQKKEPGLMESYGSFPVWSLKLIDAITPEFLISKEPVEKKKLPQ